MLRDVVMHKVKAVASTWKTEATRRRDRSAVDPVADTLASCAGELELVLNDVREDEDYLTVEQFAARQKPPVTKQTVRFWIRDGQLAAEWGPKGYVIPKDAKRHPRMRRRVG